MTTKLPLDRYNSFVISKVFDILNYCVTIAVDIDPGTEDAENLAIVVGKLHEAFYECRQDEPEEALALIRESIGYAMHVKSPNLFEQLSDRIVCDLWEIKDFFNHLEGCYDAI